jgi:hypothetical protein
MARRRKLDDVRVDIEGKSCVFVGASTNMVGRKLGDFIDRFDVVIKTMGASGNVGILPEDLGARNDVIFVNAVVERQHRPLNLKKLASKGVKQIVFRKSMRCRKYTEKDDNPLGISKTQYNRITGIAGMPLMAAQASQWMLDRGAGFIFITGCDFYMHNGLKTNIRKVTPNKYWIKGYQQPPCGKKKPRGVKRWGQSVGRPTKPSAGHNIPSHLEWFAKHIHDGKIYCDDILANILNAWFEDSKEAEAELKRIQMVRANIRRERRTELSRLIGPVR